MVYVGCPVPAISNRSSALQTQAKVINSTSHLQVFFCLKSIKSVHRSTEKRSLPTVFTNRFLFFFQFLSHKRQVPSLGFWQLALLLLTSMTHASDTRTLFFLEYQHFFHHWYKLNRKFLLAIISGLHNSTYISSPPQASLFVFGLSR